MHILNSIPDILPYMTTLYNIVNIIFHHIRMQQYSLNASAIDDTYYASNTYYVTIGNTYLLCSLKLNIPDANAMVHIEKRLVEINNMSKPRCDNRYVLDRYSDEVKNRIKVS